MNCAQVKALLPLWVEGDLVPTQAGPVQAHLGQCPACRNVAQALGQSQAWLREPDPAPFTAADRAELRRAVLARIGQEQPPRPVPAGPRSWLLALAAGLALAVAGLSLARHRPGPDRGSAPVPGVAQRQVEPPVLQAAGRGLPIKASKQQKGRTRPRPEPQALEAPSSPIRIEFQTSNPNVRIIWLARSSAGPAEPHESLN